MSDDKNAGSETETRHVKYVFVDVVGFTAERSVEAQTHIIETLNETVKSAVVGETVDSPSVESVYLPTGDGICVGMFGAGINYDVHITVALSILSRISEHNGELEDTRREEMRQFEVRVGLNENVDNLVTDINGERNVAGAGINTAQRVMDLADGQQILVSQTVHEVLSHRERYMDSFNRFAASGKHGRSLSVYQYLDEDADYLDNSTPVAFVTESDEPGPVTDYQAYYIAIALQESEFITSLNDMGMERAAAAVTLHFRALDEVEKKHSTPADPPHLKSYKADGASFAAQHKYYFDQDSSILHQVAEIVRRRFRDRYDLFINPVTTTAPLFVNAKGKRRLLAERPSMCEEFEIEEG